VNFLSNKEILEFSFESLEIQPTFFVNPMILSLKLRLEERRNKNIISTINFLQNPQ